MTAAPASARVEWPLLQQALGRPLMKTVPVVVQRPMFRALPGIDLVFLVAIGMTGLAACFVIALQ